MFGMFQKTGPVITASRVAVFSTPPAPLPRGCFPAQPAPSSFTRHRAWPPGAARCPSSVAAWSPLSSSRPSVAARVRLPRGLPQPCGQLPRDRLRIRAPPWRPAVRGFPVSRGRVTSGTIPFSQALLGHTPDTRDGRAPRCGEAAHTPLFCRLETAYV